jgi:hypothetical protein
MDDFAPVFLLSYVEVLASISFDAPIPPGP